MCAPLMWFDTLLVLSVLEEHVSKYIIYLQNVGIPKVWPDTVELYLFCQMSTSIQTVLSQTNKLWIMNKYSPRKYTTIRWKKSVYIIQYMSQTFLSPVFSFYWPVKFLHSKPDSYIHETNRVKVLREIHCQLVTKSLQRGFQ